MFYNNILKDDKIKLRKKNQKIFVLLYLFLIKLWAAQFIILISSMMDKEEECPTQETF